MNESYDRRALPAGTMIEEYRLDRVLGVGGFGIVYVAEGSFLHDIVAIKEFLPAGLAIRAEDTQVLPLSSETEGDYAWALGKFLEEAKTLAELARPEPHRNIVRVIRYIEANGTAYMVMDYEQGESLSELLLKQGTVPEPELKAILYPLLDGLERVHNASVWHRDIKPENVLIRPDGSPVLIDFGAARRALGGGMRSVISTISPAYAAREQVYATGEQGPWTDIFALGTALYQAVTGEMPPSVAARVQGTPYSSVAEHAAERYAPTFLKAIDHALELHPEDRPQSIAAWRADFVGAGTESGSRETVFVRERLSSSGGDASETSVSRPAAPDIPPSIWRRYRFHLVAAAALVVGAGVAIWLWMGIGPRPIARDALLARVEQLITDLHLQCSHLTPIFAFDDQLVVAGHVASSDDLRYLRSHLSEVEYPPGISEDIDVHPWPFCEALAILGAYAMQGLAPAFSVRIEPNKANRLYREGEFLVFDVTATREFGGYLYVDYFDPEGEVVHMLPNKTNYDNRVGPGQQVKVGVEKGGDNLTNRAYQVIPPHGRNMVIAVSSRRPLFAHLRPEVEQADNYLPALQARLRKLAREGDGMGLIIGFEYITTVPR